MTPDTMRMIDKWAGIPLSFLLSIPVWFRDIFVGGRGKKPDTSRTLFLELSEMGSAILVDPAMRRLREEAGSELYFAIFKSNYKSLMFLETVPEENIFKMRSHNIGVLAMDVFRFIGWCRKRKITAVIDMELFSRFTAMLSGLSGCRWRVGFSSMHDEGLYRGSLINVRTQYNPHVHISVNFMSLVKSAMGYHDTPYPTSATGPEEIELARAKVGEDAKEAIRDKIKNLYPQWKDERLVLINGNASELLPQRRWMPDRFAWVSSAILEKYEDILCVATGSPEERDYVQKIVEETSHPRFVNSAGVFTLEELIPLYSISTCMLTNDSGPAHFASVTDLKVFVIFGPETPALYGPLGNSEAIYLGLPCSPCVSATNHRKTSCITRPCVTGISSALVLERVVNFLG